MKQVFHGLLVVGLLTLAPAVHSQSILPSTIEYSERVPDGDAEAEVLYRRTLDWSENHFSYTPKTIIKTDAAKGEIRVSGMGKVKTASPSGQLQERPVRFEFSFHTLPSGYEYTIGYFRIVPDAKKPDDTVPFEDFVSKLAMERSNDRTHNDRRVTAQANSLASEIALSFRSYMNSRPAAGAIE